MKRIAVWIDGEIALHELATVLRNNGFHLHSDGYGRTVVDRVPAWLKHDEAEVIPMEQKKRRRA